MIRFGQRLRELRDAQGLSLRQLGRLSHYSHAYLHDIEKGRSRPTEQLARRLDDVLHAGGALVGLAAGPLLPAGSTALPDETWRRADAESLAGMLAGQPVRPDNALSLAHEWLISEPPQVYEVRSGRRIGEDTVTQIEERVHQLRRLDDHIGGLDTCEVVTAELVATIALLHEAAYTEHVGRRLLTAVGELCQLAGWVASDAGRHAEAQRFYLTGVRAGHAAGDSAVAANNLSSLAYQVANIGDPRAAVILASSAVRGAEHAATATTRALLFERVAWAAARADEPRNADRSLGRVEEAWAARQPENDPIWVYWLDPDEIAIMAGRCWTQLSRPLRAVPVLESAVRGYGDDRPREASLYLSWLSEAYLQANEVEEAARVAGRALRLARTSHSARSTARIAGLRESFVPYRGTVAVDEFEDQFTDE